MANKAYSEMTMEEILEEIRGLRARRTLKQEARRIATSEKAPRKGKQGRSTIVDDETFAQLEALAASGASKPEALDEAQERQEDLEQKYEERPVDEEEV